MKLPLTYLLAAALACFALADAGAQSQTGTANVFVYSQSNDFRVWCNGVGMNSEPRRQVMITSVAAPICNMKVLPDVAGADTLRQRIYVGADVTYTYLLVPGGQNAKWKLTYMVECVRGSENEPKVTAGDRIYYGTGDAQKTYFFTPFSEGGAKARPATFKSGAAQAKPGDGCGNPKLAEGELDVQLEKLDKTVFESEKLMAVKRFVENYCITSDQLYKVLQHFNFEKNRLDLAQFAYQFVIDPGNFDRINSVFEFEESEAIWIKYVNKVGNH